MKKLLFIIVALMVGVTAQAQLQVTAKKQHGLETLAYANRKQVQLERADDLFIISLKSSNRFDSPAFFFLGKSYESAAKTIDDLIKQFDQLKHGEYIEVDNLGNRCTIFANELRGVKRIHFMMFRKSGASAHAGVLAGITKEELIHFHNVLTGTNQ